MRLVRDSKLAFATSLLAAFVCVPSVALPAWGQSTTSQNTGGAANSSSQNPQNPSSPAPPASTSQAPTTTPSQTPTTTPQSQSSAPPSTPTSVAPTAPKDQKDQTSAPQSQTQNQAQNKAQGQAQNSSPDQPKPLKEEYDPAHIKKGSIDDVNAVGHRTIGGRGLGNWYSTNTEIGMGQQISQQVLKTAKIVNDPVIEEYVNRLGQNLVKNSDSKVPFTIKVIDTDQINAFALPGGYFFVNSGLILAADNEAELAGVMAHEIAHVAAHHQAREMTRMNYANLATVPMMILLPYSMAGYAMYQGVSLAIPLTFLKFQRDFEEQADYLGIEYMYKAGYDPNQLIAIFEKLEALEKTKPGLISEAFSTHPQTPERVEKAQEEIATILPPKQEYVVDTSEFHDIKARLARIENRRKLKDGHNPNKPTLRRVGTDPQGNGSQGNGSQQGDDRPTLHPRDNN